MKSIFFIVIISLAPFSNFLFAQAGDLPEDYLSKKFHATRRDSLRSRMPANSVAAVFAFPTRTFSNDVEYVYHANPDMYYFTGYKEPHSVLFIFKEAQKNADGTNFTELFLYRKEILQLNNGRAED